MKATAGEVASDAALRVQIRLENWLAHPHNRYSLQRAAEFVPSAVWCPAEDEAADFADCGLFNRVLVPTQDGATRPAAEFFRQTSTDSVLLCDAGRIRAAWHAPHVDPRRPHLLFSIGKSITGILAGILIEQGKLDPDARAEAFIPELEGCAAGTATVRQMLDMSVDLVYTETFDGSPSVFMRYRQAVWGNGSETLLDVVASMPAGLEGHGRAFRYISPVTDVLGLVIEAASGRRYSDFLGERLLDPLGMAGPVMIQVDRQGYARATGGISMTARDLARLGQCLLDGGRAPDGRKVVPAEWIADMRSNGDHDAWQRGDCPEVLPEGAYRSLWYAVPGGEFFATGIYGQFLWCDPATGRMIVKTASRPVASDIALTVSDLKAIRALAGQVWT